MSKVVKRVTMALILTVILTLAVAGTAFAANGPNGDCELPGPYGPYEGDSGLNGPNGEIW
ncbi:hypothetical protein ACFLXX_05355 [Chloroflexota bacterium]